MILNLSPRQPGQQVDAAVTQTVVRGRRDPQIYGAPFCGDTADGR
jgi:hypothetical protein